MAVIDELQRATYNGIQFFYRSSSEARGFKYAEHLYPGSDNFTIEQLGKVPRKFTIQAQVQFSERDVLNAALDAGGTGLLSHPMYGNLAVKVTTYNPTDNINDLGLYEYSLEFVVEFGFIIPTVEKIATTIVSRKLGDVLDKGVEFVNKNVRILTNV